MSPGDQHTITCTETDMKELQLMMDGVGDLCVSVIYYRLGKVDKSAHMFMNKDTARELFARLGAYLHDLT